MTFGISIYEYSPTNFDPVMQMKEMLTLEAQNKKQYMNDRIELELQLLIDDGYKIENLELLEFMQCTSANKKMYHIAHEKKVLKIITFKF